MGCGGGLMDLPIFPVIKVNPNELTCTGCGETFPTGTNCPRCALDDKGQPTRRRPPTVATISYLRPEEYVLLQ